MNFRFDRFAADPRFAGAYRHFTAQPSWVWITALVVGGIVIVLPILLLAAAAAVCILIVYFLLSVFHRLAAAVRNLGEQTGRRNVRVVRPNARQ